MNDVRRSVQRSVGSGRFAPVVAWGVLAIVVLMGGPLLVIGDLRRAHPEDAALHLTAFVLPLCGALLANQQPRNVLGWCFLGSGTLQVLGMCVSDGQLLALAPSSPSLVLQRIADLTWPLGWPVLLCFGVLLFPEGLPSPRWRPVAWTGAAGVSAMVANIAASPLGHVVPIGRGGSISESPEPLGGALRMVGLGLVLACATAGLVSAVMRYRAGSALVRSQLRLLVGFAVAATTVSVGLFVVGLAVVVPHVIDESVPGLVIIGYPLAVTVALLRHRLLDLDLVVSRLAMFSISMVLLVVTYAGVVWLLAWGLAPRVRWSAALVAACLLAGLAPVVFDRVAKVIRACLLGSAHQSYDVLSGFSERARNDLDDVSIARTLAASISSALRVPYVEVVLAGESVVEVGMATRLPRVQVPMASHGTTLGHVEVAQRSPSEPLSDAERDLLAQLAGQAAASIHFARAASDARHAGEELELRVAAERLRLQRDLHDEIGPRLSGVLYVLQALRGSVTLADAHMLEDARAELLNAVADVRRIAHDLRPRVLDDEGLIHAITRHAQRLSRDGRCAVTVTTPKRADLPSPIEVALYRVALEALSNVGRHSNASTCTVRLDITDDVASLRIEDNGTDVWAPGGDGVGLASMQARASELGGTFSVMFDAGTRVEMTVPVHA